MVCMIAAYLLVGWALRRLSPSFLQLPEDEMLIATVHAVYILVYATQLLPYTVVVCQMIFGADFPGTTVSHIQLLLGVFFSHGVLYVVEGQSLLQEDV